MKKHITEEETPPKIKGWEHSDRVLVFYRGNGEIGTLDQFSVAYYHYNPPFKNLPEWVDFREGNGGQPEFWWELPNINKESSFEKLNRLGGSLFKTAFGEWQWIITLDGRESEKLQVHSTGKTPEEVIRKINL